MLKMEAIWLSEAIAEMSPSEVYPLLNTGSSSEEFRKETQPWIDEYIFAPAQRKGYQVVHSDIKEMKGVDLVGDLGNQKFISQLAEMKFNSVLCSNLIEHVYNKAGICEMLELIIKPGGLIFITCPYSYPYHADPIDNGFRPSPDELATLFKRSRILFAQIIDCGTIFSNLITYPLRLIRALIRLSLPFYKYTEWQQLLRFYSWIFKRTKVTCLVLRRIADP